MTYTYRVNAKKITKDLVNVEHIDLPSVEWSILRQIEILSKQIIKKTYPEIDLSVIPFKSPYLNRLTKIYFNSIHYDRKDYNDYKIELMSLPAIEQEQKIFRLMRLQLLSCLNNISNYFFNDDFEKFYIELFQDYNLINLINLNRRALSNTQEYKLINYIQVLQFDTLEKMKIITKEIDKQLLTHIDEIRQMAKEESPFKNDFFQNIKLKV